MGLADAVRSWWAAQQEILPKNRSPNAEELHAWLQQEHGYTASAKSVRKWVRQHLERPRLRPYRRVETPPGAQAQVDWSEHPGIDLGDGQGARKLWVFHMVLSHSRQQVDIACLGSDQLWWHQAHLEAFRRLGGVPAVVRIDNCKTGMSHGAGVWGTVNPAYQDFARSLGFHVDPCPVRHPEAKGKVERGVRTFRGQELARIALLGLSALQGWSDQQTRVRSERRRCAATGTSVAEAFAAEGPLLRRLPDPCPEPFDIAVTREECRIRTSLKLSGLPHGITLASFDFAFQPAVERRKIETLATAQWIRDRQALLLLGPPGVGKSHLAAGLGVAAIERGLSVVFYRIEELPRGCQPLLPPRLLSLPVRSHPHHLQQEHPRLARDTGRRRDHRDRHPRPTAARQPRPEHQRT
jgi:transposase